VIRFKDIDYIDRTFMKVRIDIQFYDRRLSL